MKTPNSSSDIVRDMAKALRKAKRQMYKEISHGLLATEHSAGFILPPRGVKQHPRSGFQVFVKIAWFDEQLLKLFPNSGGLLMHATDKQINKARGEIV